MPSYVIPQNQSVDMSIDQEFSCKIQGTCTAWRLNIYNNETNALVYDSTKIDISTTPLYNNDELIITVPSTSGCSNGFDYKYTLTLWGENPTIFVAGGVCQATPTSTEIKLRPHSNIYDGMMLSINGEMREITNWDTSTFIATVSPAFSFTPSYMDSYKVYSSFIITPHYYFKARKNPVVMIDNYQSQITERLYTFYGTYVQEQFVPLKYFIFNLYDDSNELIDTTGKVFNERIEFSYDGFVTGETYKVELIVENQDSVITSTGKVSFDVLYSGISSTIQPITEILYDQDAIKVEWSNVVQLLGKYTGSLYELGNGRVIIPESSTIYYDEMNNNPLDLPTDFSVLLKTRLSDKFKGKIIELDDSNTGDYYNVSYDEVTPTDNFQFDISGIKHSPTEIKIIDKHMDVVTGIPITDILNFWNDLDTWDDYFLWSDLNPRYSVANYVWMILMIPNETYLFGRVVYDWFILESFFFDWGQLNSQTYTWDMLKSKQW